MASTLARTLGRMVVRSLARQSPGRANMQRLCTPQFAATINAARFSSNLVEILNSEIEAEQQQYKETHGNNPPLTSIGNFNVTYDRAEVELTSVKSTGKTVVSFNVNHSFAPSNEADRDEADEDLSQPTPEFTVIIEKNGKKLAFECQIAPPEEEIPFDIIEVYIFKGENVDDNNYAVSGHVLDANLYDRLKSYLVEQGIDSQFLSKFQELAVQHEHQQYLDLLKNMKDFVK